MEQWLELQEEQQEEPQEKPQEKPQEEQLSPAEPETALLLQYAKNCVREEPCLFDYQKDDHFYYYEKAEEDYLPLFFYPNGMREDTGYDGILTLAVDDFDQDEHNELLIIRLESALTGAFDPDEDYTVSTVTAYMYEVQDGQVYENARKEISGISSWADFYQIDFIAEKAAGRYLIACEYYDGISLSGDGIYWDLYTVEYRDGGFNDIGDPAAISGSDWPEDDLQRCIDESVDMGFHVLTAFDQAFPVVDSFGFAHNTVVQQDSRAICLASIGRKQTADYDAIYNMQPGDRIVGGYTKMFNYISADNPILGDSPSETPGYALAEGKTKPHPEIYRAVMRYPDGKYGDIRAAETPVTWNVRANTRLDDWEHPYPLSMDLTDQNGTKHPLQLTVTGHNAHGQWVFLDDEETYYWLNEWGDDGEIGVISTIESDILCEGIIYQGSVYFDKDCSVFPLPSVDKNGNPFGMWTFKDYVTEPLDHDIFYYGNQYGDISLYGHIVVDPETGWITQYKESRLTIYD